MSVFQRCVPDFNIANETMSTVNQSRLKEALETTNALPELQRAAKYCNAVIQDTTGTTVGAFSLLLTVFSGSPVQEFSSTNGH